MQVWCPYCSSKKLCDSDHCVICFNRSFASHKQSKYWSRENNISPREVLKSSNNTYYFECECGHTFENNLGNIIKGQWCPYCAIPAKRLCDNECEQCFKRSFASHEKSRYWSKKNIVLPRQVLRSTHNKYIFDCVECGNEFSQELHSTVQGQWCGFCKNKTEGKFKLWLETLVNIKYVSQPRYDWCKNDKGNKLPFDFEVIYNDTKFIVEIDGDQHFKDIDHWKSLSEVISENDRFKSDRALENGYNVIRIYQPDIWKDNIDWKEIILSIFTSRTRDSDMYFVSKELSKYENHF
ncbi:MAG: zinc-ribbon domain-containing protein [Candidatus Colwellbacteria bacterium]|nr:zinc-ribbon domain-containing protein [Candidatus Colwellbacteria bacterium]